MKQSIILWFSLICILFSRSVFAQAPFPAFLQGTWKVADKERYEHWDRMSDGELKGVSYSIKNGQKIVSEYLKIKNSATKLFTPLW
ncbi:hypothetical protein KUH03_38455 [Sphingobacterium sp. E70]|uniref:hypothetical protein n=1 Tax=Sphingobacterium sp. E70 TaxID=2853439 RepID=UPI00211C17FC|nr:hypothetical protein [Sphingobacterium sp. E70]ULT24732.1 hypothetical protein KUH03_38455 [Sphingobacterium sp. E70]